MDAGSAGEAGAAGCEAGTETSGSAGASTAMFSVSAIFLSPFYRIIIYIRTVYELYHKDAAFPFQKIEIRTADL